MQQLLRTSQTRYLIEFRGRTCIIDEELRPENGDTVLLDMSGMYEWGNFYTHPHRVITDEGLILEDDLLEDMAIFGVVTHEVTAIKVQDSL
ncbi:MULTISPECIES: hypothetical protein [unclassified Pantoea]|uniref:hypothetical protein n=1 Tax=unclassified Pantoea TaxID=2630326 RepID=UPI00301B8F5F